MNDEADNDWYVVVRADGAIVASTSNAAGAEAVRAAAERDTKAVHYCLRATQALAEAFMDVGWRMEIVNRNGVWEACAVVDTGSLAPLQGCISRKVHTVPVDSQS
ncbi:hypothetical protein [Luteibacter yeojuensis]|nr:hypothetical protein [Luteibacter yeojuensis]